MSPASPSIDAEELERFSALAESWWDPKGPMAPLHRLNPARLGFLRQTLAAHFSRDARSLRPFEGLRILDIGCGGGLISEPLARLGAAMTGIDAAEANIAVARAHARGADLDIDYRQASAEELSAADERFDAVLALEVIEHVADPTAFFASVGALVQPGAAFIGATINRTARSFALAIVGGEYILRWLPPGTHDWRKFLRPSEFVLGLRRNGLLATHLTGVVYDPFRGEWSLSPDLQVNYMVAAVRR